MNSRRAGNLCIEVDVQETKETESDCYCEFITIYENEEDEGYLVTELRSAVCSRDSQLTFVFFRHLYIIKIFKKNLYIYNCFKKNKIIFIENI